MNLIRYINNRYLKYCVKDCLALNICVVYFKLKIEDRKTRDPKNAASS